MATWTTIFGDTVADAVEVDDGVQVLMQSGTVRAFDLVVGAGGVHSTCTAAGFGPQADIQTASATGSPPFSSTGYRRATNSSTSPMDARSDGLPIYHARRCSTMFLLIFIVNHLRGAQPSGPDAGKAALRDVFADRGWECNAILDSLDQADDIDFDEVVRS